ncbi:Asp23/Gls24 family envelope stress response protein [Corynebacterium mustelae]|uniref:Asp23/Gls24 family envelope stress response protein n=1 Tax=Corynebacterium mustelae TaxID=571915 RepID=UPI001F37327A|nr:Asp23/Gls24 family envelope stress response protein [Corynebacterium mustelae]
MLLQRSPVWLPARCPASTTWATLHAALTDRIPNAQTNVAGGISVEKGETQAAVDVTVVVEYGVSIVEVGNAIRRNIIEQVEGTTGLEVIEVNVNVTDVHLPDEDSDNSSTTELK